MRRLHRGYVALDIVKMAAGIIAVGFWSPARLITLPLITIRSVLAIKFAVGVGE